MGRRAPKEDTKLKVTSFIAKDPKEEESKLNEELALLMKKFKRFFKNREKKAGRSSRSTSKKSSLKIKKDESLNADNCYNCR